jgi:malate/lactate dehydrogenase
MELEDSAFDLVLSVVVTTDLRVGFSGVQYAILLGGFPRKQGMERKDLIAKNVKIMKAHGQALEQFASRDVKVLVVANPANTNCLMVSRGPQAGKGLAVSPATRVVRP